MSSILVVGSIPSQYEDALKRLGYKVTQSYTLKGGPSAHALMTLAADYVIVLGRGLSFYSAMVLGAAMVGGGCKVVIIDPMPDILELCPVAVAAYVGPSIEAAIKDYFSKMVNAVFEKRS